LVDDKTKYLEVATTRPETMFGDVALFVHPEDKRYKDFINKEVINPSNNKVLKVMADEYVDIEFGTGVLKVTPGHDFNDYELGKKYKLEMPSCIGKDGKITSLGGKYEGKDRLIVRKELVKEFKANKILIKEEDHKHQVGHSSRSNAIIEPILSKQ
jgi:valyl-tRNA synthetase